MVRDYCFNETVETVRIRDVQNAVHAGYYSQPPHKMLMTKNPAQGKTILTMLQGLRRCDV